MSKLMAIFAHPDDEGVVAGTMARHARDHGEVMLVCATRGEVGEISDPSLATPETLGAVRQAELEAACAELGVQHLAFLPYRDSGMEGTPENEDPRALIRAEPAEVIGRLTDLMRSFQPDAVVTFEPFGWYGHPDHKAVSRWVTPAFSAYTNGATSGAAQLYHAVIKFTEWRRMVEAGIAGGYLKEDGFRLRIPEEKIVATEAAVTHSADVRDLIEKKQRAMMSHRTQFSGDSMFARLPADLMRPVMGWEHYIQVVPQADRGAIPATPVLR